MKILPVNPTENVTPESLRAFLGQCCALARTAGRPQLVSISLAVDHLDPLAVLESIFEPSELHFYAERPAQGFAVAGAEAVLEFTATGPSRFTAARDHIGERRVVEHFALRLHYAREDMPDFTAGLVLAVGTTAIGDLAEAGQWCERPVDQAQHFAKGELVGRTQQHVAAEPATAVAL